MKAAIAAPFFDSAAVSLARYPREGAQTSRLSRRALLQAEDRTGRAFEIVLRLILGSSLLAAVVQCLFQFAQP